MATQIFTFGYGQVCQFTGEPLDDKYATVIAPNVEACKAMMLAAYGRNWAFQYDSVEAATAPGARLTEHSRMVVYLDGGDLVVDAGGVDGGQ